jgi:fatty-acyl-CoA synthase
MHEAYQTVIRRPPVTAPSDNPQDSFRTMAFATDLDDSREAANRAPRAPSANKAWLRALSLTGRLDAEPSRILPRVIDELAERFGDAPALISERESFSFKTLAERSHRYARWALAERLMPGATVCLLMPNRPEYLAAWLGITSVGGVVALLNVNLSSAGLAHCIDIVQPEHVIVAAELVDTFASAAPHLAAMPRIWLHGEDAAFDWTGASFARIDVEVDRYSAGPLTAEERRPVTLLDRALCIYTSGTTGLPKAANVSHHRVMSWSYWFAGIMETEAGDRMYDCLPMYHSVGGIVAIGSVLVGGGSVVIREGFSARRFWDEVVRFDCTLFQYIGELCRYLVKAPRSENETRHRLRLCCGNGLRLDVWEEFEKRFRIPRILEFYAATEGNFSLYNAEGKPGAIGRIPAFLAHRFPAEIVKFDVDTGAPARDENGFCIRAARNEAGEAIGRIETGSRFEGYTNTAESEKKILRNVFAEGDAWMRTGDLMRRDEKGYFYFVDRTGDTFRWKGENVATTEVSETVAACPGVVEANVYGVAVPGTEGRAGMASLVIDRSFDFATLRAHLARLLPAYARPLFLRIHDRLEVTVTFKQKKQYLVAEAFDPTRVADQLYFDDAEHGAYVPLDHSLYERILAGEIRL